MKKFIYVLFLLLSCNTNNSRDKPSDEKQELALVQEDKTTIFPEVGKPMPDFTLNDVKYFATKKVTLDDFKGKWLILDYWNRLCRSCIASFPKVNDLRKEFKDKVEFVLVSRNDGKFYSGTEKIFERERSEHDLDIPLVYDANFYEMSGLTSVPHVIWIDDTGIVRAVTFASDLSAENLETFLSGKIPKISHKLNKLEEEKMSKEYDKNKPLLIHDNGGKADNFLFRSLLTKKNEFSVGDAVPSFFYPFNKKDAHKFSIVNSGLDYLYKLAYGDTIRPTPEMAPNSYGEWWYKPILEVKDSEEFNTDWNSGKGIFCYELIVPENKTKNTLNLQKMMQRDLKNFFGYNVQVEKRLMPYWKLIINKDAKNKLITTETLTAYGGDYIHEVELTNVPMSELIKTMWGLHQWGPPFIDETEIDQNIDITLTGKLSDIDQLKKALQENGLELVKSKKEMKVIVIRDPIVY